MFGSGYLRSVSLADILNGIVIAHTVDEIIIKFFFDLKITSSYTGIKYGHAAAVHRIAAQAAIRKQLDCRRSAAAGVLVLYPSKDVSVVRDRKSVV